MSQSSDSNEPKKPATGLRSGPRARAAIERAARAAAAKPAFSAKASVPRSPRPPREGDAARGPRTPGSEEKGSFRKPWQTDDTVFPRVARGPRPDAPVRPSRAAPAEGADGERPVRPQARPDPERRSRRETAVPVRDERAGGFGRPKPEGSPRAPAARSERGPAPRFEKPAAPAGRVDPKPRRALPRAHIDPEIGVRVSKLMAERGLCSRREADAFIERGWVFVNGVKMAELGARVSVDAEITLSPQARNQQHSQVTILLNKPVGFVSGQPEPGYEPAVTLITAANQYAPDGGLRFKPMHLKGLAPAGRLDIDSTGLLVLTQNGRVARSLIGEDSKVEKEYLVRVEGELIENGLALLNHGLELDGKPLRPAQVEWLNEDQLRFILREGRKRQIRRMCELVGLHVTGLKRVRMGRVKLGDLPLGMWRYLREDESF